MTNEERIETIEKISDLQAEIAKLEIKIENFVEEFFKENLNKYLVIYDKNGNDCWCLNGNDRPKLIGKILENLDSDIYFEHHNIIYYQSPFYDDKGDLVITIDACIGGTIAQLELYSKTLFDHIFIFDTEEEAQLFIEVAE